MKSLLIPLLLALAATPPAGASASHDHHDEPQHHASGQHHSEEAHVHGIAQLQIVLEGGQLEIVLRSPAVNLAGFEHRATSAEERAIVEQLRNELSDAASMLSLQGGECESAAHSIDVGALISAASDSLGQHRDTTGHRDTDDAPTHNHPAEHEGDDHPAHSSIEARYRYDCARPPQIRAITVALLKAFHGIETLEVQWIVHGRQGAATLKSGKGSKNRTVHFR